MDHLMMAFTDAPDAVRQLLHRVMDFQMGMAGHYLAVGIDWASLGDDLGSQRGLLFSRAILDEFFVPEYRRLAMLYRQRGVRINFHSCGHIEPIIDVFIDLGVSVLNPVQATANNLDTIRRLSQGRMALQGGVSTHTIMLGPPEKIRAEVRQRLWQLGRDGGYFCAPDQGMPFPPAHKAAFDEALAEYGTYPLRPPG
jgi:uroporphyrinogen decarboxylase